MPVRLHIFLLLVAVGGDAHAAPFELSDSYAPSTQVVPGSYGCRSGLDMNSFTWTVAMAPNGVYTVTGYAAGNYALDQDGTLVFTSGPFAPDDTATMLGRLATRRSDGNPTIVLGYFFADGETTYDFCARFA